MHLNPGKRTLQWIDEVLVGETALKGERPKK